MTPIKQQTIFLTANSYRGHNYSFVIDLLNSLTALNTNSAQTVNYCEEHQKDSVSWHS